MKKFLNFKIVCSAPCFFCNSENETPIHLFSTLAIKQNLFRLN